MTPFEQETIINFNEKDAKAEVYTASARVSGMLIRKGLKPYKTDTHNGQARGWYFKVPKWAAILKPDKHSFRIGGARKVDSMLPSTATSALVERVSL